MEILKENLTIDKSPFIKELSNIEGINNKIYNQDFLLIDVNEDWTKETELDALILKHDLSNFSFVESDFQGSFHSNELIKKIKKNNSLKEKIIHFDYEIENQKINFKCKNTFDSQDQEDIDSIIEGLTGEDALTTLMNSYEHKEKDGKSYYNEKRSKLVTRIYDENDSLTSEGAFQIDIKLKNVKDSLRTGDWITSQKYLSLITVDENFTQDFKDELNTEILEYISIKY